MSFREGRKFTVFHGAHFTSSSCNRVDTFSIPDLLFFLTYNWVFPRNTRSFSFNHPFFNFCPARTSVVFTAPIWGSNQHKSITQMKKSIKWECKAVSTALNSRSEYGWTQDVKYKANEYWTGLKMVPGKEASTTHLSNLSLPRLFTSELGHLDVTRSNLIE